MNYLDQTESKLVSFDGKLKFKDYLGQESMIYRSWYEVESARNVLDKWLAQAVTLGVYDLGDRILIPKDRVLEIVLTYEDIIITK